MPSNSSYGSKIPEGSYKASKRGVPDVALLGDRYPAITKRETSLQKVTSASAPFFASLIVLICSRLRQGKSVIGFLNPLLESEKVWGSIRDVADDISFIERYEKGELFVNADCAASAWNPASGLGQPGLDGLRTLFV